MTKELIISNITGIQSGSINYSTSINAFVAKGFTSNAGNHYFSAVRLSEGIVIKEDIGQGYAHKFLNGLKIFNLRDRTLIADETFHCQFYTTDNVCRQAKRMLLNKLEEASQIQGFKYDKREAERNIDRIVTDAFHTNQNEKASQELRRLIG
jgi:hypothetical protein